MHELFELVRWGSVQSVADLLEANVDCEMRGPNEATPLHWAVECGHIDIVKRLLLKNPDCNAKNSRGNTPLHGAFRSPVITQLLLEKGANINQQNQKGETPLHWAVEENCLSVTKILLEARATIDLRDKENRTPLYLALDKRHITTIQLLLDHGAYSFERDARVEEMLDEYWKPPLLESMRISNESFYTTLLLSGVSTIGKTLPEKLSTIRRHIEETISSWFGDLQLSEAAFHEAAPSILRSLPVLMYWLEIITQSEIQWREKELTLGSQGGKEDYMNWLTRLLLLPMKEIKEDEERLQVLKRLGSSMPVEMLTLIREMRVLKLLAANLIKDYPLLNPSIANYMVEDSMAYPKAYGEFYRGMLKHHWREPYIVDKQQLNTLTKRDVIDESSTLVSQSFS